VVGFVGNILLRRVRVFFLPLAVDIGIVLLASRPDGLFWIYPFAAASGFVCGAAVTYYIGQRLGEAGLRRLIRKDRLAAIQRRVQGKGAVALAVLCLIPPPFPFTACILAAGALRVRLWLFLTSLGLSRLLQYQTEAVLAHYYGKNMIAWFESDTLEYAGALLFGAAIIGTGISAIQFVRKTRTRGTRSGGRRSAA
jgi:membrane protein YqaA with SNARE-associated domain